MGDRFYAEMRAVARSERYLLNLNGAGKKVKMTTYLASTYTHSLMHKIVYTPELVNWMIERDKSKDANYQFDTIEEEIE